MNSDVRGRTEPKLNSTEFKRTRTEVKWKWIFTLSEKFGKLLVTVQQYG